MKANRMFPLICLLIFLIVPSLSWAQQAVANVDAVVTYTEPDRLQGGGNLTQLTHTTMYFEVRDVGGVVLDQWTHQFTATAPTGGGGVIYTLPPKVITEEAVVLMVWASATNNIGEGLKSVAASKPIPKIDLKVPDGVLNLDINISISVTVP